VQLVIHMAQRLGMQRKVHLQSSFEKPTVSEGSYGGSYGLPRSGLVQQSFNRADTLTMAGYLIVMYTYCEKLLDSAFSFLQPRTFRISSQIGCYPVFQHNLTCSRFPRLQPHDSSVVCTRWLSRDSATFLAQPPVRKPPKAQRVTPGPGALHRDAKRPSVHQTSSNEFPSRGITALATLCPTQSSSSHGLFTEALPARRLRPQSAHRKPPSHTKNPESKPER